MAGPYPGVPGRPLKGAARRSREVKLRVTEAEFAWLLSRASSSGVPVSDILRVALASYSRRVSRPSAPAPTFDVE